MPDVVTPAMSMTRTRHAGLASFWFASHLLFGAFLMILVPSQMRQVAPESPAETQGFILGWGAIPAIIIPLFVGALSDRCRSRWGRRRPYLAVGVALTLVGLGISYYAGLMRSLWLYFLGYLVLQVGTNTSTGAYSGVIPDEVPESERGVASGWMAAFSQLGTIAGALSGGLLVSAGRSLEAYLVVAASLVIFLFTTMRSMSDPPMAAQREPISTRKLLKSLWIDPRKHPDFAWVWITRALVVMGLWTVQQFMQYFLLDRLHVESAEKQAGFVLMVGLLCATITGVFGGSLSDKVGRKPVVYVANTIVAISAFGFILCNSMTAVYLVAVLFGLGYGAYYSVDWALGCDVLPNKEDAAKDMGIWHISMVLPQSIALPIAGAVLGRFGVTTTLNEVGEKITHYSDAGYVAIFTMAGIYFLLAAILLRNVKGVR